MRRRLRAILDEAGIEGVTPHSFRRNVATVLDRAAGADLAGELLGNSSPEIARVHYIEPDEIVNPVTAEILESLAPRQRGTRGGKRDRVLVSVPIRSVPNVTWSIEYEGEAFDRFVFALPEYQRTVLTAALDHVLTVHGIDVCSGDWGKPLGKGSTSSVS